VSALDPLASRAIAERAIANVERAIVGKRFEVELALAALLAQGHVLIEDVPGVGKTVLAKAIAHTFGGLFKRIQFTPDLLPSDVTGVSIFNQRTGQFEFRPGPIMANVVLADEINRATPKTQSALLEAMEERQVSVDGISYPLNQPFLVIATQNPVEYEGTFPLPEAQLDRFLIRLSIGYPMPRDELAILERATDPATPASGSSRHPVDSLPQVVSVEELLALQAAVRRVYVDPLMREYVVAVVGATRGHPEIALGASPRGSLALFHVCQSWALLHGRDYVIPDDVKALAESALAHRLILSPAARLKNVGANVLLREILAQQPIPGARPRR